MRVERFGSAASFLAAAESHLLTAEPENALILGLAHGLVSGSESAKAGPYFAVAREGTRICGVAFQTLPGKVGVTRISADAAPSALARDVHEHCRDVASVVGPDPSVEAFALQLAAARGLRATRGMAQRIHALRRVLDLVRQARGTLRVGRRDDEALLTTWVEDFHLHVGDRGDASEQVRERVSRGQLFLWEDGAPVSMAGATGKTPNGVRVSYVYTPPAKRGRGYATAIVASLSQRLLDGGNTFCCLYTDLANPTSNAIYKRIGYEPVCDAALYALA